MANLHGSDNRQFRDQVSNRRPENGIKLNKLAGVFVNVVLEKLVNQVHVAEEHAPAAVPLQVELVQCSAFDCFLVVCLLVFGVCLAVFADQSQVVFVEVGDHFVAGEASNGDDHGLYRLGVFTG